MTGTQIVSAFDSDTNTSRFVMTFNDVEMYIYIRIDPTYTSSGMSMEECYNNGFWSIMVSSKSVDVGSLNSASYGFNIYNIFETMIDVFTFNTDDCGLSGFAGTVVPMVVTI